MRRETGIFSRLSPFSLAVSTLVPDLPFEYLSRCFSFEYLSRCLRSQKIRLFCSLQLVERFAGITEVTGSNPVDATWIFEVSVRDNSLKMSFIGATEDHFSPSLILVRFSFLWIGGFLFVCW